MSESKLLKPRPRYWSKYKSSEFKFYAEMKHKNVFQYWYKDSWDTKAILGVRTQIAEPKKSLTLDQLRKLATESNGSLTLMC